VESCGYEGHGLIKEEGSGGCFFVSGCLEVSVGIVDVDKRVIIEQPGPSKKE
jgi:hypothetical protein